MALTDIKVRIAKATYKQYNLIKGYGMHLLFHLIAHDTGVNSTALAESKR